MMTTTHLPNAIRLATTAVLAAIVAIAAPACQSPAPPAPTTTPAPVPVAATQAPAATAPSAPEAPTDYKNTIRWSTASEVENFAYDVYRADSEDGPFVRINASPIAGSGTTDETSRYSFVDREIDPRKEYYYYVESISLAGEREKFTPVTKAKAKIPGGPPPEG